MCQCVIAAVGTMIKAAQGQVIFLRDTRSIAVQIRRSHNQRRCRLDTWTLQEKKKRTDLWVKLHFQGGLTLSSSRGLNCWSVSYCIIRNRPPNDTVTTIQRKVQIFRYFVRTVTFGAKKQAEDSKNKSYACVFDLMLQDFPMLCLRSG